MHTLKLVGTRANRDATPIARRGWLLAGAVVALLVSAAQAVDAPRSTLTVKGEPAAGGKGYAWKVSGIDPLDLRALASATRDPSQWPRYFSIHARPSSASPASAGGNPPLSGTAQIVENTLIFHARYPVEGGMSYDFVVDLSALPGRPAGRRHEVSVAIPPPETPREPTTIVTRVSPSGDVLPENLLRFYIEFSAPMSRGEAYEHLQLLDQSGRPVDLPFLELGEELWDRASGRRFTALFDPGRIKSGLKPREEAGPVLVAGRSYTLVVDSGWRDAKGLPLRASYRKTFRVGPADTTPPDPTNWRFGLPAPGTLEPLELRAPEPLDVWIFRRALGVRSPAGKLVEGTVEVSEDGRSAEFRPVAPWIEGRHELIVDRTLEDLVGNTIGRPFEVDVFEEVQEKITSETVHLGFMIKTR